MSEARAHQQRCQRKRQEIPNLNKHRRADCSTKTRNRSKRWAKIAIAAYKGICACIRIAGDGMNARLEIFVPLVGQKEDPALLPGGSPIAGGAHVAQADREHSEQQMDHLDDPVIVADQQ